MPTQVIQSQPVCNFCGKSVDDVKGLVAGPNHPWSKQPIYICEECVAACVGVLEIDKGIDITGKVALDAYNTAFREYWGG